MEGFHRTKSCEFFLLSLTSTLEPAISSSRFLFESPDGQQLAGVRFVIVGLLIMFFMIFRPSGILGKKEELLLDVK